MVERLHAEGASVTVVDNLSTGKTENLAGILAQIDLIVGDLRDLLKSQDVQLHSFDQVFHFVGNSYVPWSVEDPARDYALNLENTFLLLEALRSIADAPRLVNVSSAAVYGNPRSFPIRESDPTAPISPYGVSKLAAERYVAVYSRIYGLRAASVRPFSVYGPRQRKQVVYDLLHRLRSDPHHLSVLGDGTQARDFVHVQDLIQALLLVGMAATCNGEVYNVASGTTHTIAELVSALCSVCDQAPEIVYSGDVRPGDAQKWVVDIDRLRHLGFEPTVGLRDGLAAVRDWYDGPI